VLLIGKTVSHYKIISKLGEGGMGVVYKAEDTRLDRSVALKFLPPSLATQDVAKKRFIHEAKAASSLEHPNICTVHDVGETDEGQMFIAMPCYDGETLQEKIAKGSLEIGEAIDIVMQLASGLAKAHEQGIVHRDIKPGNILITKDGHVKILDFGLAKLATQTRLTKSGSTLGTIAYMSPEQASGGDVDARSDIFSLGAVFYELLTGALPFKGDHEAAIVYGIMHNDPEPLRVHRGDTPEGLQQVIDMALAKNVDERCQSTLEFKDAIVESGLQTGAQERTRSRSTGTVSRSPFRRVVPWVVLGVAILAIALVVIQNVMRSPQSESPGSVSPTYTQLTFTGDAKNPVISPDGQFVVYIRETETQKELLVRDVGGGEPIVLMDSLVSVWEVRWSPDSARLLVAGRTTRDRHIYIIPRLGGSIRRLEYYYLADWSPDGRRLAVGRDIWKKLSFIDVSTGKVESDSLTLEFPFLWIQTFDWSPSGERFLVGVQLEDGSDEIWTIGIDGGDPRRVVQGRQLGFPHWASSGESIYYVVPTGAVRALWRVRIDPRSGDVKGEPVIVLGGITGNGSLAFSNDGKWMTYGRHIRDKDLWLVSTDENQGEGEPVSTQLTTGTARDDWPSVSPDGREIAFVRVKGEASNVFIMPIKGGAVRQVTFMNSACFFPVWSPDGRDIAFTSFESGTSQVWKVGAKGGAADVFENTRVGSSCQLTWAPGESILYQKVGNHNFMILDPESGDESPLVANEDVGWIYFPVVSSDGTRVAVRWTRPATDDSGLWIVSMVDSSQTQVYQGHKHVIRWSRDDQWLYYFDVQPPIGRIRPDGSGDEVILTLPFEGVDKHVLLSMSPDARNIVGAFEVRTPSDIWLIENFDPGIQ
jgi:serine/threonine protein kinase/WD40 repeat protein